MHNLFQMSAYNYSLSKIKHKCRLNIDKLVEHVNPVLPPDFEFHVSKAEEEENEEIPNKISRLLGHLSHQSCKQKYQEDCPEDDIHLQRLEQDATILLARVSYFSTHFNRGNPLFSLIYDMEVVLLVEFEVPSMRVLIKSSLIELKRMTTLCHGQLYQQKR